MTAALYTWRTEADAMADAARFACLGSPSECKDRLQPVQFIHRSESAGDGPRDFVFFHIDHS